VEQGLNTVVFQQNSRFDMGVLRVIEKYVRENNIDVVNFHGAKPNFLYVFLRSTLLVPGVTTVHSDYRYDFSNNWIKHVLFTPLNMFALKKFNNFICVSERIKKLLDEQGFKGRKYVVNNGVDTRLKICSETKDIREKYNIPGNAFVYTMIARMHPVKNHMGLLEAFKRMTDEKSDVRVMLVGSGDFEEKIRLKAKELGINPYVIFCGRQENPVDYINAGDVNILTSFNETFPIVILEGALAMKAAICSDVGDIRCIIDSSSGFIVDPNSIEDIFLKMKEAYYKRTELLKMGRKLYDVVTRDYTLIKFCKRYYDAYNEILAGDKNG